MNHFISEDDCVMEWFIDIWTLWVFWERLKVQFFSGGSKIEIEYEGQTPSVGKQWTKNWKKTRKATPASILPAQKENFYCCQRNSQMWCKLIFAKRFFFRNFPKVGWNEKKKSSIFIFCDCLCYSQSQLDIVPNGNSMKCSEASKITRTLPPEPKFCGTRVSGWACHKRALDELDLFPSHNWTSAKFPST